jgi:hypothetical protein
VENAAMIGFITNFAVAVATALAFYGTIAY